MGKVYVWHIEPNIHYSQTTVTPNKQVYTEGEKSTIIEINKRLKEKVLTTPKKDFKKDFRNSVY